MQIMRGVHFVITWATFLILFEPHHDVTESCLYESHQNSLNLLEKHVQLFQDHGAGSQRPKRHSRTVYNPIRITLFYSFDEQLLPEEQTALKLVLNRAVRKISRLFSVIREDVPLLLPRSPCPSIFNRGINIGKCAKLPKGYEGEVCLDNFKIPNDHLKGYIIYNLTHPDPIQVFKDGSGLSNTDFVLYITSQSSVLCNPYKTSALAYAAPCQLQNEGRPLAGQVNFCPRTVKAQKFDQELLYKTAIHELFHALGFSNKLFDKFQTCDSGNCRLWPQPIFKPLDGTMRLVTDAVVREMSRHFNCSNKTDFGGPIQLVNEKPSSHWDAMIMHSSIMGSREQKPYHTLIDPITLAVFEDSGWYKVNYSEGDNFIWGQGQGCSFGLKDSCEYQDGFCTQNITGCHHLHLTKARCNYNPNDTFTCGVYAADQRPCFLPPVNTTTSEDEVYLPSSRCFISSITPAHVHSKQLSELSGRCYERKCDADKYYLRINHGEWLLCHPGSYVKVPGHDGRIICPGFDVICAEFIRPEPMFDELVVTSTSRAIQASSEQQPRDQQVSTSTLATPSFPGTLNSPVLPGDRSAAAGLQKSRFSLAVTLFILLKHVLYSVKLISYTIQLVVH
ncbi:ciliated left-right organizer metallopeptidase-like isoform X2 [Physella acuta]|uniref:ciliated left-right organizer metallopeptidase-like isoform X2 n=1 Tax=Physella acuta TaxID=109671 RepID=UPI0027DD570B|nr:ciliated left-right organizer metallopeptidase-like isoform X2 [Physella acuta]